MNKNPGEGLAMLWNGLKALFHTHYWKEPYNDEPATCEDCGYQPRCRKHGCTMYVHGYDYLLGCKECFREWHPEMKCKCDNWSCKKKNH